MGFFSDLFGDTAAKAAGDAALQRQAGLRQGLSQETPYYQQAVGATNTGYGAAQGTYQPLYDLGLGGAGAYADITGAAGTAGQDRARALFQTDPGYQFARDQALQATERQSGTGGGQYSGNVLAALEDRASGLAQQQYGNYVQRLAPFLGYSLGAGGGLAGTQTGQANALASLYGNQGNLAYNTEAGVGNAAAAGTLGAAQARTAAAGNVANLGAKLLGYAIGGPAGGALGGSLFGGGGVSGAPVSDFTSGLSPSQLNAFEYGLV